MNEMDADYTIELGNADPVLDFPWKDPSGKLSYVDIKSHPELISTISEAARFPELGEFLSTINSSRSSLETAKCDVWATEELAPEEEIFGVSHKFASYVDAVFRERQSDPLGDPTQQPLSFSKYENFAKQMIELLRKAPDMASTFELCVRRCFFEKGQQEHNNFYFTLYVNGYGDDEPSARKNWAIGLRLVGHALLQLSARV